MSRRFQVDPFDLLGQEEPFPIAVTLPGEVLPSLSIAWNSFHQNFLSELWAFFHWTRIPQGAEGENLFRDCRIKRSIPARAITAAALWHIFLFVVPWPNLPGGAKPNPALENSQLTWSGPIDDLPLLNVPKHASKPAHAKAPDTNVQGTDAYHPRQRIYTDPVQPNHPRQTLVKPSDPMEAPKFLPSLPNVVQLGAPAAPARPKLQISEETLAKLRPKVARSTTRNTPQPDAPNLETTPADISIAAAPAQVERPKLDINAGSAPRVAQQAQQGDAVAAPEMAAGTSAAPGGPTETIIALSATPGPAAPVVEVPKGNLAARVAMSPEGRAAGTDGGAGGSGNGATSGGDSSAAKNSMGISISGGNPKPSAGVSGAGGGAGKLNLSTTRSTGYKPPDSSASDDPPERTGPPNFASLPPGAQPEQIFAAHRVYSMNVNMPNLNSVTGSWVIRFSELHLPGTPRISGQLNGPVAVRKIDPKYPQNAIAEHIEGEVILYGVIRPDGSVDSIQLVHGVDKQLDANAIAAFAQWKFEPATKSGQPIALEAIVHIPFRGPERE